MGPRFSQGPPACLDVAVKLYFQVFNSNSSHTASGSFGGRDPPTTPVLKEAFT